jgi:lincosamide nucleotidyltransferase A/C/D/E
LLLGEQTREHDDLDVVVARSIVPLLIEVLADEGYEVAKGQLPTCIVLLDSTGRQVDVHPVDFDDAGDGVYRMEDGRDWAYPAAGFAGNGRVLGRRLRCLTPEVQVLCHAGYELGETDHHDLAVLRGRFGISTGS